MPLRKTFLIIFLVTASYGLCRAQDDAGKADPAVGLVLSGGGAKCIAQIGALQVLDSLGIKLDYIGGTSMGAIVGSMYALGYPVDDIEAYMRKVNWEALLTNEVPRNRLGYFDRKAESRYLVSFPIQDGKVRLPSGFNYSQYILKELSYLTQKSNQYDSFKDFPIPFVCVATNIENGQLKVFEDGRLMDALRATSAFPSLFTPYEIDGSLYVDGGVVNNYPVNLLKERGMDVIIGVDVQDFLYTKDELNSIVRILEQTSSFTRHEEYVEQLEQTDILIQPNLVGADITSFHLFDRLLKSGRAAARKQMPKLLALARRDTAEPIDRSQYDALPVEEFYIDSIIVRGNEQTTYDFILSKIRIQNNEVCSIETLEKGLDQLYGTKYYRSIDYQLQPADTGYTVKLNVKEEESLSQFRLGLHYDSDFKTALLLNYTRRNLLFKNSRFSFDFAVGDNPRTVMHYFVDRGPVPTLGIEFRANRFETRLYQNQRPVTQLVYLDFSTDVFIQSTLYDAFAIGGGIQFEGVDLSQDLEVINYNDTYNNYLNYYGFIDFDSYDDVNYPSDGSKVAARARIISRLEQTQAVHEETKMVIDASAGQAFTLNERVSMAGELFGAFTIGPNLDYPYNIFLGSMGRNYINYIYPFVGYRYMELVGRNALVLRTDLYFEFVKQHYIIGRANVGRLEPSFDGIFNSDVLLDGYSIGYSFDSPLGPLEVNMTGSTTHSNIYTYIALGFWF